MPRQFAGGIKASQNGPAGGVSGPSDGTPIRPGSAAPTATQSRVSLREQDCFLPITNVIRIVRKVLPRRAKISEDAKVAIQESLSEYIRFVTRKAKERCQREQRKTITAEDVIWAMGKLGFGDYVAPLNLYLQRYREAEGYQSIGLGNEHFPIVKHRHHPQIWDTVNAAPLCLQPFLIPSSMLRPPPPSSLIMLPTVPSIRTGAGYFLGFHGGGDGAGTSNSEAVPMHDFFPLNSSRSHLRNWSQRN